MFPQLSAHPLELVSTTQLVALGTTVFTGMDQGRKGYRMVSLPVSTATVSGILLTAAAAPSNSTGLALNSVNTTAQLSAGSTQLVVTNGSTAVTANQFQDGMLEVLGTNGIGQAYRIAGNSAAAATTGLITVTLLEPLRNLAALVAGTNTVNLRVSECALPVASASLALPVGVTIMPIASNTLVQYGWVQHYGKAYVNAGNSGTIGQPAVQDLSTAGNFANTGSGAAETSPTLGVFASTAASSLASVFLSINAA